MKDLKHARRLVADLTDLIETTDAVTNADEAVEALRTVLAASLLGDIHLSNDHDGNVEVRVEVDGVWRTAIKTPYDGEGVLSHFVSCDGDKPKRWPASPR